MYIVICGAGRLGSLLAKKLREDKHRVGIIDRNKIVCEQLAEEFKDALIIYGDATSIEILKQAQIEKADVCVSLTSRDEDNIIISHLAKKMFGVKRTVARVNDPSHTPIYTYMEVDIPIDATSIVAKVVEEEASFSDVMELLSVQKGRLSIIRVDIPETSPIANKELKSIKLPPNSVLVSVLRGSELIIPSGKTKILGGDEVIAATLIENEKSLITTLVGKL